LSHASFKSAGCLNLNKTFTAKSSLIFSESISSRTRKLFLPLHLAFHFASSSRQTAKAGAFAYALESTDAGWRQINSGFFSKAALSF
jgi:hypothetical protein